MKIDSKLVSYEIRLALPTEMQPPIDTRRFSDNYHKLNKIQVDKYALSMNNEKQYV